MNQSEQADAAIRNHVGYSIGAALIPIPIGDVLAITGLQIDLVKTLANIYEQDFTASLGKTLITSLTGSMMARIGASAIKSIPVVGTLTGGAAQMTLAGGSTYAVGHLFKSHFAAGGTIDTFNPGRAREMYDKYVEKGRAFAVEMRAEAEGPESVETVAATLEKLARLRDAGELTAGEFMELKQKLIAKAT